MPDQKNLFTMCKNKQPTDSVEACFSDMEWRLLTLLLNDFVPSADLEHLDGGAGRDRTDDLKLAKLALSQLSYGPVSGIRNQGSGGQYIFLIPDP
jgi:hypothetical protein